MIYGVEFGTGEKILSYSPDKFNVGDLVIFKTASGENIGKITSCFKESDDDTGDGCSASTIKGIKDKAGANIVRKATQEEYDNSRKANIDFLRTCIERAKALNIQVKVVDARVQFDRSELHIDLLPEKKTNVKALLNEISRIYKEKIVIHQVGRRDLTRRYKTHGICGRLICCASFLNEFEPINVDLIKQQNLSCGTAKLTGLCGKLMCCLAYEKENYKKK